LPDGREEETKRDFEQLIEEEKRKEMEKE